MVKSTQFNYNTQAFLLFLLSSWNLSSLFLKDLCTKGNFILKRKKPRLGQTTSTRPLIRCRLFFFFKQIQKERGHDFKTKIEPGTLYKGLFQVILLETLTKECFLGIKWTVR